MKRRFRYWVHTSMAKHGVGFGSVILSVDGYPHYFHSRGGQRTRNKYNDEEMGKHLRNAGWEVVYEEDVG